MWWTQINKILPVPLNYKVWMSKNELACFDRYIRNANNYLEFGSGGSTIRALVKSKCQIVSVESGKSWVNELRTYCIVEKAERTERLKFVEKDLGPTGDRGFPTGGRFRPDFPKYSLEVFETDNNPNFDCMLIDGRFRVACALQSILSISNPDTIILFHDIWNRKEYHIVLKYLVEIERVESMGVFKIYFPIDRDEVEKNYLKYKYNPL